MGHLAFLMAPIITICAERWRTEIRKGVIATPWGVAAEYTGVMLIRVGIILTPIGDTLSPYGEMYTMAGCMGTLTLVNHRHKQCHSASWLPVGRLSGLA